MTPHNEHIMLKYARTRQAEQLAEARLSPEPWAQPARGRSARGLAVRVAVTASLVSAALLTLVWLIA